MRTLRTGSAGQEVQVLQLALSRAGFLNDVKDGIFGTRTNSAVRRFQSANSLLADGIVGVLTWARLRPYISGFREHTVARGETFYMLAERYNTSVSAITAANPSVNPLNLQVGTRLIIPLGFDVVPTDIDYSSELLSLLVEGLCARYPFIRCGSVGMSVMGRELYYLQLGSGPRQVMYNAAHHANEWITTPVLMKFAEELGSAEAFGGRLFGYNASELLRDTTLYLIPMVNPDGVDLCTGALASDSPFYEGAQAIAGNYPNIPFPRGWKANIIGTDLNLNYPANWERAREIKYAQGYRTPAPRDYVGTAPLSARESRAMYDFTLKHSFALTLSYHSQGSVIYWKYGDFEPENSYEIGRSFSRASGYSLELTPGESAYAGYKDWFIQTYNLPGYTIEVGRGVNPLPISQFDRIYSDNIGILVLGMTVT